MSNPKISTLSTSFPGSSLPSPLYLEADPGTGQPSGTVTVAGGVLSLAGGAYADIGYYCAVNADGPYDLTGSALFARITPDTASADYDTGIGVVASNYGDGLRFGVTGGSLYLQSYASYAPTAAVAFATPYDPAAHAWLQLAESGGTIALQASPSGQPGSWTTLASTTTESAGTWTAGSSSVQLYYGSSSGAAQPAGTGDFASLNVAPASPSPGPGAVTAPLLGMYETHDAFPTPGPGAWPSGPTTNLAGTYMAWGQDLATYVEPFLADCNSNGLLPFVELEPWHSGSSWNITPLFSDITGGTWDTWLEQVGTLIAATGKTVILTFAHEFNVNGQYPWSQGQLPASLAGNGSGPGNGTLTAAEWVAGWQYVHDKVNSTAGGLAVWMWAPNAYTGGTTIDPTPYWPGSSYVDMVGADGYPNVVPAYNDPALGTFAGQFGPTVTIIRNLGYTADIFISETNLAQMVASGGESIASFVADMHAAGMSGIFEFESANWNLPQMSAAQWTEYNSAVAAAYGTSSGSGSGGSSASGASHGSPASTEVIALVSVKGLYPGARYTGSVLRSRAPVMAVKAQPQSVLSDNTALQPDQDLLLALDPAAVYYFKLVFGYTAAAGSGDIRFGWSVPPGTVMGYTVTGLAGSAALAPPWHLTQDVVLSLSGNGSTAAGALAKGTITTTEGGILQWQWCQHSSSATPTTVLQGSSLTAWKVSL